VTTIWRDWYVNNLGLLTEFEVPERLVAAVQDSDGFTLFLEQSSSPTPNAGWMLNFQVDSVDGIYERLTQQGIQFTICAELTDPDGHRVRLWDAASMKAKGE
jgi:hypothetical protein